MSCHILHFSLFVCVQGDVSETVRMFFEESKSFPAATKSLLTIQEVDASLMRLAQLTKEDEQQSELENIAKKWDSSSSCQTNWARTQHRWSYSVVKNRKQTIGEWFIFQRSHDRYEKGRKVKVLRWTGTLLVLVFLWFDDCKKTITTE